MGILDEAIREHLELKRRHGAGDSELKQLEDQAFGSPERPGNGTAADQFAEAPTEFLTQPETAEGQDADAAEQGRPRREGPSIADLQEAPEPAPGAEGPESAEEEHPAMEHEIVAEVPEPEIAPEPEPEPVPDPEPDPAPEPQPPSEPEPEPPAHTTEERHAIAEQPTELHDIDEELAAEGPPSPSDEELVEEEIAEPRLAPTDPLAGLEEDEEAEVSVQGPAPEEDEDDEFWNEQRLSDELDQALEAPSEPDPDPEPEKTDEDEDEAYESEPTGEHETEAEAPRRDEDLLEETPDFLEETPEDDELWFEQKPPKDFDFDD
jgi:hypothetical protein